MPNDQLGCGLTPPEKPRSGEGLRCCTVCAKILSPSGNSMTYGSFWPLRYVQRGGHESHLHSQSSNGLSLSN